MTALLRAEIRKALDRENLSERLVITPILDEAAQLGSGSVDLRLGTEFIELNRAGQTLIDPLNDAVDGRAMSNVQQHSTYVPLGEGIVLHPGQFVLGSTLEFLSIPSDISGQVVSRSSWGRLGLLVATAVAVNPGFKGVLTLELVNTGGVPIMLRAGARIAQLQLWGSSDTVRERLPASGKYHVPVGPEAARLHGERDEGKRLLRISEFMSGGGARVLEPPAEQTDDERPSPDDAVSPFDADSTSSANSTPAA
jgi:dCTP deaminase